jgi:hypothetical protein
MQTPVLCDMIVRCWYIVVLLIVLPVMQASPVSIGGRPAYVEEKRTMGSRGLRISPCHPGPLVN